MDDGPPLIVPRPWIVLTIPTAVAVGVSSAVGAFVPATYAQETASWAAQGVGQDYANLIVVLPAFLASAYYASRGSLRGLLVWLGLLTYFVYSYVLYALCVHFGPLFLVYVAALGLSFYALAGSLLTIRLADIERAFRRTAPGAMSALLLVVGSLFALLWLSDIARAYASGGAPPSVAEAGLPVNPIHVLDLAFALPALIVTAILLRRRHVYGLLLAVPCATFLQAMGVAIIAMAIVMARRGVPVPVAMPLVIAIVVGVSAFLTYDYLRDGTA